MLDGLRSPMKIGVDTDDHNVVGTTSITDIAIPLTTPGIKPKLVAVSHDGAGNSGFLMIKFNSGATVAASLTSGFLVPAMEITIFDVSGYDVYSIIASDASTNCTVTPLENF